MKAIYGNYIYTDDRRKFKTVRERYIIVDKGKIRDITTEKPKQMPVTEHGDGWIMPSFIDAHLHAVQFENRGLGYDRPLLPWLQKYTFPEEARFSDPVYAKGVIDDFVRELWRVGSLRSAIYSSLHYGATRILFESLKRAKLFAYVGKTSMNRNGSEDLEETTEASLENNRKLLEEFSKEPFVKPVITPRFIPSCTEDLLRGLAQLADEFDVPVQSHINENPKEIEWVKTLDPLSKNYFDAYDRVGLIRQGKTIMGHCIYNTDQELEQMLKKEITIAHCPSSNFNLSSGIMKTKQMLQLGMNIRLSSDIGGGESMNMNRVIQDCIKGSKLLAVKEAGDALDLGEAIAMATTGGDTLFDKTGRFEKGYSFDALVIEDRFSHLTLEERLEKFVYQADPSNIVCRYLAGEEISEP